MHIETKAFPGLVPLIVADIFELAGAFRRHGDSLAGTIGQSQARWQVLSAASAEPRTVPQIARRLGVSRQAVQRLANLLVEDGSARFESNPDHLGSPHLILTERGRADLARLSALAEDYHRAIGAQLESRALETVHLGLRRLIEALNSVGSEPSAIPQAEPEE
jgi:DNA-binding MarR family transcriptional regulator